MEEPDAVLDVHGLGMVYNVDTPDMKRVFQDITFQITSSSFVSIVGPSGAGKTTLLNCLCGLTKPTEGAVWHHGVPLAKTERSMSVVFQDYSRSLFPWLTVAKNVSVPLRVAGVPREERPPLIRSILASVGLAGTESRYPWQLSGGMQQRVAIARALISQPEILFMDEPFASVDAQTRFELEDLALSICRERGVTVLLVTHDVDEAAYLSDQVIVLSGSPATVRDIVDVPLPRTREQVETRALPEFVTLRRHLLELIRSAKASMVSGPGGSI